jgi:aminopeptidase N
MLMMIRRLTRSLGTAAFLLTLAGPLTAGAEQLVPLAPVPTEAPYTHRYQVQQSRLHESETKTRLLARAGSQDATRTANMELYDVYYYGLELDLDPDAGWLTGRTRIQATVTGGSLVGMDLHLRQNMAVSEVTSDGTATGFTRSGDVLSVGLDREYQAGEQVDLVVAYSGNPDGEYFGWSSYGGQPLIWTLSEPYGARWWWACKDLNTDKADSVDISVTVPENLIVASNGLLAGTTVPEPGKKTFHWQERYPIPTYLVSLAVHPFAVFGDEYTGLDGTVMPLEHYVVPSRLNTAMAAYAVTVPMLEAFAQGFGEYPFIHEKYGHAHFPWGGGMEHQTMTSLHYDAYTEHIISHELGHQWWGDMVTCADFGHIWLNEGFATWSEAYWREINEGMAAYHQEMNDARYLGDGTIFVEDPSNFWEIFNYYLSYLKASWVPHMLRHVMGDEDFFAGLAQYRAAFEYDSATTEQFRDVMAQVSGLDLDPFFQQWIYEANHPIYSWSYTLEPAAGGQRLGLRIEQVQSDPLLFTMPLDVRVWNSSGQYTDHVVQNDRREQWFFLDVAADAAFVELDPDDWVLCEKVYAGTSDAAEVPAGSARLTGNYPNPFNPSTTIRFELPAAQEVSVSVFDAAGRLVATLLDGPRGAGAHQVVWDGRDRSGSRSASGVYFVRLSTAAGGDVRKITMVQ